MPTTRRPQPPLDATAVACCAEEDNATPPWDQIEPLFLAKATARCFTDRRRLPLYVVVEKILTAGETLPADWLVAGTTGYDFLHSVGGLFVDPAGLRQRDGGSTPGLPTSGPTSANVAYRSKMLILHTSMASSVQLLAHQLSRISERHRRSRDFTLNALRLALRAILAAFPVYRTYIRQGNVLDRDRQVIGRAAAQAKRRNPATDAAVFDFIRDVLLLQAPPDPDESGQAERERFVGRFQQVSGPVMAKGVEDTAYYRDFPLSSLNDVGGDPARGAARPEEFHRDNSARQKDRPLSLLATTTHDTKRTRGHPCPDQRALRGPAPVACGRQSLGSRSTAAAGAKSTASPPRAATTNTSSTRRSWASGRPRRLPAKTTAS